MEDSCVVWCQRAVNQLLQQDQDREEEQRQRQEENGKKEGSEMGSISSSAASNANSSTIPTQFDDSRMSELCKASHSTCRRIFYCFDKDELEQTSGSVDCSAADDCGYRRRSKSCDSAALCAHKTSSREEADYADQDDMPVEVALSKAAGYLIKDMGKVMGKVQYFFLCVWKNAAQRHTAPHSAAQHHTSQHSTA
jgi:hypothetical protein